MKAINVVLIGMPGVGKSFLGQRLAQRWTIPFIDLDQLFEQQEGTVVEEFISLHGDDAFLKREEEVALSCSFSSSTIIATGGSIIYCQRAMRYLREHATIIFLRASLPLIEKRLSLRQEKNIVGLGGKTIALLLEERQKLYAQFADLIIDVDHLSPEEILLSLENELQSFDNTL